MSAADDSVSVEEAFGGWVGTDIGQEAETETAPPETEGAAPAGDEPASTTDPNESQEGSEEDHSEESGEAEIPEWKAYGFKDENAMWTSFKEAQRYITSLTTPQAEEEEEEEEGTPSFTAADFSALGEIPQVGLSHIQREQLANLMQADPKAAALWAMQNRSYMEPQDYKSVQNNWAQADPEEYHDFRDAVRQYQQDAQRQESEASQREWVLTQQREHAIDSAKQALPLMDERSDEFGEWLSQPENSDLSNMLDQIQDPQRLQNALVAAFYQYAGPQLYQELVNSHALVAQQQQQEAEAAAEAEQAATQKGRRAGTQTKTAPSGGTSGAADADEAIRAAILNPYGS